MEAAKLTELSDIEKYSLERQKIEEEFNSFPSNNPEIKEFVESSYQDPVLDAIQQLQYTFVQQVKRTSKLHEKEIECSKYQLRIVELESKYAFKEFSVVIRKHC